MVLGSSPVAVTSPLDFAPASSKDFVDIHATIECGFTLKCVPDMTRTYSQTGYFLLKVEIKHCNIIIDGRNFFDQLVKNDRRTYGNNPKLTTGQGDDYTTSCLLDYPYFKENYKLIAKK